MRRLFATVAFIAVLVLVLPVQEAGAHKAHRAVQHPTTDPVTLALKLGEEYWHATPCDGDIALGASAEEPTGVEAGVLESQLADPNSPTILDAWTSYEGEAPVFMHCVITLNAQLWPSWEADDEEFHWFCDVMTHELGHLFGHGDDGQSNPRSIEYPALGVTAANFDSVPECRHVRTYLGGRPIIEDLEVFSVASG